MSLKRNIENISKNVQLTYEIRDHLLKGEINKIGNSLNKSWELKKTFSNRISNDKLNVIHQKAILNGAKGGKLLGAGGGGFFLFFVDIANKNRLIKLILKEKMTYINVNFENEGMTSWCVRI